MLTGFYALGLMQHSLQERASHVLDAIDAANAQGRNGQEWEFAEYHHGQTYQPMGTPYQAWSAAAGVLAYQAVRQGVSLWPLLST